MSSALGAVTGVVESGQETFMALYMLGVLVFACAISWLGIRFTEKFIMPVVKPIADALSGVTGVVGDSISFFTGKSEAAKATRKVQMILKDLKPFLSMLVCMLIFIGFYVLLAWGISFIILVVPWAIKAVYPGIVASIILVLLFISFYSVRNGILCCYARCKEYPPAGKTITNKFYKYLAVQNDNFFAYLTIICSGLVGLLTIILWYVI